MGCIDLVPLPEVDPREIIDLMNNEQVGRELPLLVDGFSVDDCREFLAVKKQLWDEYGFGPWAIMINDEFAGWGGLQPEHGDADFALILHPKFWGWGLKVFNKIKEHAFGQMNLSSITVLLPPSRNNSNSVHRLGFVEDGQVVVGGQVFRRFRLDNF